MASNLLRHDFSRHANEPPLTRPGRLSQETEKTLVCRGNEDPQGSSGSGEFAERGVTTAYLPGRAVTCGQGAAYVSDRRCRGERPMQRVNPV